MGHRGSQRHGKEQTLPGPGEAEGVTQVMAGISRTHSSGGWPPSSDLEPYGNDCFRDPSQAGVVAVGVPAHELVGLIN
jgi:hypothetical protein